MFLCEIFLDIRFYFIVYFYFQERFILLQTFFLSSLECRPFPDASSSTFGNLGLVPLRFPLIRVLQCYMTGPYPFLLCHSLEHVSPYSCSQHALRVTRNFFATLLVRAILSRRYTLFQINRKFVRFKYEP